MRLNVEWRRVKTWLVDERRLYTRAIKALQSTPRRLLLGMLKLRWREVKRQHEVIAHWLFRTASLPQFSGQGSSLRTTNREEIHSELLAYLDGSQEESEGDGDGGGNDGEDAGDGFEDAEGNGRLSGYVNDADGLGRMVDVLGLISGD